jgi:TPR repeat protein
MLNWRLATTVKQYSLALRYKHGIGAKKNLAKAAHLFDLAAANRGNVNAQYQIGMYYYNRHEFNKAVYWLECTGKQGHIQAQWQLEKHYLNLSTDLHINIGLYLDFQDAYTKVFNAFFEFSTLNLNTINRAVRAKGMAWLERVLHKEITVQKSF